MSGRRHVQTGLEEESSDSDREPLSKTFSSGKRGSRDGASKGGRTPEPGTAPAADEPAAKRQHSSKNAAADDEAAAADHEQAHRSPAHADLSAEAADGAEADPTPFAAAAAAGADDAAAAADDAAPAAAGKLRGRGSKGSKQPPGKQPPRPQRQNSKLDSKDSVKAVRKPNSKASKQPKQRAPKEPVASANAHDSSDSDGPSEEEKRLLAFAADVWRDFYDEDPWGDGREGPEDNKPPHDIDVKDLPMGKAAVGWGYWEWYTDAERWFRLTVHDYDPQKKLYTSVAEDGEVLDISAEEYEKWPDDTRVFCIPAHQQQQEQQQDDEAGQPSEQEEQAAQDAKELVGAAFVGGQAGKASTPSGKGKGKRKAPAQQSQQPRSKQRKVQQQQSEEPAAEQQQQQHEEEDARAAHGDEAADIAAATAQAAAAVAAGEGVPAAEHAAAAANEGDGAAEGAAAHASKPAGKKQQQQRTPKKQPPAGRPASGGAAPSTKAGRKAAAAAAAAAQQQPAAGEDGDGAEQQQDQAAQLQQRLEQLHGAMEMLRVGIEQQKEALQGIADMNLSAEAAKQLAAQVSRSSQACQQGLKLFKGSAYTGIPPGFSNMVGDVRKLGGEQMRLFATNPAPPPSPQQQKGQQRQQQQQGKGAGQQQQQQQRPRPPGAAGKPAPAQAEQQQQRKDRPSSGGGASGQAAAGRRVSGPNGVAAAAAPSVDLSVFLDTCAQLVPLTPLHEPTRDKAVALLAAVLQPQQGFSPFAVAQQLEQRLQQRYGSRQQQGQQGYMRHLQVLWDVLGGGDMEAAEAADKAAQDAAAEADAAVAAAAGAAEDDELQLLKAEAEQKAAAAAGEAVEARARFEGVPGDAGGAALRKAVLEGRLSAQELFDVTARQLAAEAKAVKLQDIHGYAAVRRAMLGVGGEQLVSTGAV